MNSCQEFDAFFQQHLHRKETEGSIRTLVHAMGRIDFSSNDYFGFARPGFFKYPSHGDLPSGATGSRSITGNSALAEETEAMIARFHRREAALLFNTGYMANIGLFSCLAGKGDTYISDEYIHASMIDGMRLSYANRLRFRHNDLADLEKKLKAAAGRKIVAVESLYSMDGDFSPLPAIAALCRQYNALLLVDEAHATGIYGDVGEGLVAAHGLQKEVYAVVHTFGKALGLHGAVVTGSAVLRSYLLNQARSFIYTTALPPFTYLMLEQAYAALPQASRAQLHQLIAYFKAEALKLGSYQFINSDSPIQGIVVGDNFRTKALAAYLLDQGFFVRPILSPTVPVGKERIRLCIHSFNTEAEIMALFSALKKFPDAQTG